jgi:hypothetical protein
MVHVETLAYAVSGNEGPGVIPVHRHCELDNGTAMSVDALLCRDARHSLPLKQHRKKGLNLAPFWSVHGLALPCAFPTSYAQTSETQAEQGQVGGLWHHGCATNDTVN